MSSSLTSSTKVIDNRTAQGYPFKIIPFAIPFVVFYHRVHRVVMSDCLSDRGEFESRLWCQNLWSSNIVANVSPCLGDYRGFESHLLRQTNALVVYRSRTLPFQGGEVGSIPIESTKFLGDVALTCTLLIIMVVPNGMRMSQVI